MKSWKHIGGLLVVALLCLHFGRLDAWAWTGTVVKVQDGDSLKVKRGVNVYVVRLYGIDCPEHDQDHGAAARRLTSALLPRGASVSLESMDVDSYGRIVALVTSGQRLVNSELVRAGLAWVAPRYCRRQPLCRALEQLEKEARWQRRGLWRDRDPKPPWQWRRR